MQSEEIKIVSAILIFIVLCTLPAMARVLPNMLACIIRWKESVNIQMSSARVSRNVTALALLPVFVVICANYHLYPGTVDFGFFGSFGITLAVMAVYCLVRHLCSMAFRPRRMETERYKCANSSVLNFFIITTVVMAITSLIYESLELTGGISGVLLWEIGAVYLLFLIRKTQIFSYYEGFSSGILYLCTLEILPTSLLVASVWIP